jgi:exodeoxyribonuclease-1
VFISARPARAVGAALHCPSWLCYIPSTSPEINARPTADFAMKSQETFLWHDYETFGANPMADRPAQFAALRTNADLEPVDEPAVLYCSPSDDVLPHPEACLITGITPQEAREKGLCEAEFARRVHAEMMQPGTCGVGYNSIRFDDTVTRNLFYRNLLDPYEREYKNGNSRWDLIDVARMYYALRPAGVEWPMRDPDEAGDSGPKPSFRLEDLTAANAIAHEGAHDALADVRATIELARRLRAAQPKLFDWCLSLRDQRKVADLLDTSDPQPVVHTTSRIPAVRGCTTLVLPLAVPPGRPKSVIVFDLMADPAPLLDEPADVLHDLVFTPAADLPEDFERLPLKMIHTNHVPMVAPAATLRDADPARIGLDVGRCLEHARRIRPRLAALRLKVTEVFERPGDGFEASTDPDLMLYSGGFFPPADRRLMNKILDIAPKDLGRHLWTFQDPRLPVMLFRYRARNYPETLSLDEKALWDRDRRSRLVENADPDGSGLAGFRAALEAARTARRDDARAMRILDRLEAWTVESGIAEL